MAMAAFALRCRLSAVERWEERGQRMVGRVVLER